MKLSSNREKDLQDARNLLRRHARSIDRAYLEPMVRELAETLGRRDVVEVLQKGLQ